MKFQFIADNFNDRALEPHSELYIANTSNGRPKLPKVKPSDFCLVGK